MPSVVDSEFSVDYFTVLHEREFCFCSFVNANIEP